MRRSIQNFVGNEVSKRLKLLQTVMAITFHPSATAERLAEEQADDIWTCFRFFLSAVGIVLAIEAIFSLAFDTDFSDLIHHSFPVFVALTGGVAVYALLTLLFTRGVSLRVTVQSALLVGGAALIVMITLIFGLLAADFTMNFESVRSSSCAHRTIMCLLSGNIQYDYELIGSGGTIETQGWSYGPILIVILLTTLYYTHVLSTFLKRRMRVARWRTYVASFISVLVLSPAYLLLLNTIYWALYGSV